MIAKILLIIFSLVTFVGADELPFRISTPNDSKYRKAVADVKPDISEAVAILIEHLREPKEGSFIVTNGSITPLKWRVQHMTVISSDIVAVSFSEGHVEIFAIYVRNEQNHSWDLKGQIHGKFSVKSFPDSPQKK